MCLLIIVFIGLEMRKFYKNMKLADLDIEKKNNESD
jgi:hypothetical protein